MLRFGVASTLYLQEIMIWCSAACSAVIPRGLSWTSECDRRLWKRRQGEESVSQQVWAQFVLKVSRSPLADRDAKSKKYDSGAGDLRPPHCRTPVYTEGCWRAHVELIDLLHLCCCHMLLRCNRDQEISDLQSMLAVLIRVIKSLILMPALIQCDI